MSQKQHATRRRFLLAIGAATTTSALAGCGSTADTEEQSNLGDKFIPINNSSLERYRTITKEGNDFPIGDWWANVILYSDINLRERIQELTLQEFDQDPMRVVGTIFVETQYSIPFTSGEVKKVIDKKIRREINKDLQSFGVDNITQTDDNRFEAMLNLPELTVPLDTEAGTKKIQLAPPPVTISAGFETKEIDGNFRGYIWISPQNYSHQFDTISLSGALNEGIDVEPKVNLQFEDYESISRSELAEVAYETEPITADGL